MLNIITSFHALPFTEVLDIYAAYAGKSWEMPQIQTFYGYLKNEFFSTGGVYALWDEHGDYVAALRLVPWENGFLITGLETKMQVRNRGYATDLLTSVTEYARKQNVSVLYSHVHKNNKASLAVHTARNFSVLRENAKLLDGSVVSDHYTLLLNL